MKHQGDIQGGAREARGQPFSGNDGRAAKPIYARRSFFFLTLIMVGACATVMAVISVTLYRHEIRKQRELLQVTAQSQARLIEAIARYDANVAGILRDADPGHDATAATLSRIINAHEQYEGFGKTGEFTLARRDKDSIVFILRHRHGAIEQPAPVAFDSDLAEPMRRALNGLSGTVIGLDYRGETVLAAHEPVAVLNLGIVAKIDMAEIRKPFIRSGLSAAVISLLVVLAGTTAFFWIGKPIIARLEAHSRDLEKEIEDRIQAEEALRESEIMNRSLLEGSPVCNKIIDLDFKLRYMSAAGLKMLKLTDVEPYYGQPFPFEFYPESVRATLIKGLKQAMAGEISSVEVPIHDIEGHEVWCHTTFVPAVDDDGRVEYVIGTSVDITDRKRAEEQRLSLERQMQHAQKLESLGVLAGGIAHDFNNLLMTILGNADLALLELSPYAPARENIKEIEKASKRAAELAKQMLAYSGKGRFVIESIDLRELIGEMAHLLKVSISKKAELKYNFADNLPPFDGDATQIRQIIMNLITNASEAIGDKSGVIALSTGAMECDRTYLDGGYEILRAGLDEPLPEGLYVYLEVADTGCGMDNETIEKAFDPFFSTKFSGRGLGLAAVLGIVRGHHGAINIYSELTKGTTFKILFPASELPVSGDAIQKQDMDEAQAWHGRGTVLIADDEETIRVVGKQMLSRMGFSVLTAADGREAVEVFRKHADKIDCVLLDLTMPRMNGEEAFRELRRIRPDVRVILCSGYNEQDVTQHFAGKGLAGFIQKPYILAALRAKLMEVLPGDKA